MEKQNNEYIDLMPKQEEVSQDLGTGFEIDFGNANGSLEGVPTMDLGIDNINF